MFAVLFLDAQNRLLALEEMFRGTLTQTSVYPREVVKRALDLHAAAVILAHNHPSGAAEPSRADESLTQTLKSALALVDVRVLDHLVVGQGAGGLVRRAGPAVKAPIKGGRLHDLGGDPRRRCTTQRAPRPSAAPRASASAPARERRERDLFAPAVGAGRAAAQARARRRRRGRGRRPLPRQRQRDEAAVLRESISDEFDVESLLETDDALSFRRPGIGPDVVRKLRRGVWALQASSTCTACGATKRASALAEFLRDAGARRPALRARGPRQGQRLARARAGAEGQGEAGWRRAARCSPSCRRAPPKAATAR